MKVRWSSLSLPLLMTLGACTSIIGFNDLTKVEESATNDAGTGTGSTTDPTTIPDGSTTIPDAATGTLCSAATPWGAPVALPATINTGDAEGSPTLTPDELTIFFERSTNQAASGNIFTATRGSAAAAFGTATLVPGYPSNDAFAPSLSPDGLTLVSSAFASSSSSFDLFAMTRATATGTFGGLHALDTVNKTGDDDDLPFFGTKNELFFVSSRGSNVNQIWRSTIAGTVFGTPAIVNELAGTVGGFVSGVSLSQDGLNLYFGSDKAGGQGMNDIWMTSRATTTAAFGPPANVTALNSASVDEPGWISADNCRMYIGSFRTGGGDIYLSTRTP